MSKGNEDDVNTAVLAANKAFKNWSKSTGYERSKLMNKLADLMERDLEHLA